MDKSAHVHESLTSLKLKARVYFEVLVLTECTLRAIRRLMKDEGYDLSKLEDSALICEMLKILDKEKE